MSADALPTVDGRRARRDQNRERVVDALLELYREGDLQPSLTAVAERSGVSHRSVFRYFEDLDELYRVAIERQYAAIAEYLHISEIGQGSLDRRIDSIVTNRLDLYEIAAPVARVGLMRAPTEPIILDHRRDNLSASRDQIDCHFAVELSKLRTADRAAAAEGVTAVLSMETMETLCFTRQLSRPEAGAVMRATIAGLVRGVDDA
ncbi:MAG: TetR/AcrR family transcriptional regulator [Acidimicrobiales bacterium]|nr:TetR/AcrR family transcriptional regulator [Acidimicrobiales bacterium]